MARDVLYSLVRRSDDVRIMKLMARKGTLVNEARKSGYFDRQTGELDPNYKIVTYELTPIKEEVE